MTSRIVLVGLYHETNTFSATTTGLDLFERYQFVSGGDLVPRYRGTGTELGGAIGEIERRGDSAVGVLFASAIPSGPITGECLDALLSRIDTGLREAGPYDGVVVVLHGAAAAVGVPDVDGAVLDAVRAVVGATPLVATIDFHANVSARMVAQADAIVGYDTYPHVDMAERGAEAVALLLSLIGGRRLHKAHRKLPLLTVPQVQSTDEEPMASVMRLVREVETRDGIATATVAMGFPYAESSDLGASVLVYGEEAAAEAVADELADTIWQVREAFAPVLIDPDAIAGIVGPEAKTPVVLVDPADNVGGGSAGDGTVILDRLVKAGVDGAVIVMCDPAAAASAAELGVGATFSGPIGGGTDRAHGAPIAITGRISYVADSSFVHSGPYMTGVRTQMGLTAIIDVGGLRIVVTSLRTMPFDIEQLRCLGIEPADCRVIVVKSAIAWRAAYGAVARSVFTIDTPGICPSNLSRLPYRNRPRPVLPLDPDAQPSWSKSR